MQRGVKYYSYLEASGYGLAAMAYIEALLAQGVQVYWTPIIMSEKGYQPWTWAKNAHQQAEAEIINCVRDPERSKALLQCLKPIESYQCIVIHLTPEYWARLIEPGGVHIGYTVWETSSLPAHFPDSINLMDKVLVPSEFNKPIFRQSGVTIPIEVIPHILSEFDQLTASDIGDLSPDLSDTHKTFVFYSINTWTPRKALWTLLHCYLRAFSGDDQVELRLKTSIFGPRDELDMYSHKTDELVNEICAQYPNPARIILITDTVEPHEIDALHQQGDCYVSAAHSEGWGLGAFEAAAHGNPVIMTGWGGQLDYLSVTGANLIRYSMVSVEDGRGGDSYSDSQQWADIDEAHMVEKMREVCAYYPEAQSRAKALAVQLRQDYSSQTIGTKLIKALFKS